MSSGGDEIAEYVVISTGINAADTGKLDIVSSQLLSTAPISYQFNSRVHCSIVASNSKMTHPSIFYPKRLCVYFLQLLKETGIKAICMDVANGYSEKFVDAVRSLRKLYPDLTIMAGNVVTGQFWTSSTSR